MRLPQYSQSLAFYFVGTLMCASLVCGQESTTNSTNSIGTISVTGRGKVKALPTTVELVGNIAIEAELAGDALTKFLATKEAAVAAVKKLGLENLQIETGGFAVGPSATNDSSASAILSRSRGVAPEAPKVNVQESLRIRLGQIHKMDRNKLAEAIAKLIDAAKESGVTFGPPAGSRNIIISRDDYIGFVIFSIDDTNELREKAEALAMEEARTKATRLAKLSGGGLGEIRSVQETSQPYIPSSLRALPPELSPKFDEIEITANLQVQFQILRDEGSGK